MSKPTIEDESESVPDKKFLFGGRLSSVSIFVAIFGLAVFGGIYVEVAALIIALLAIRKREPGGRMVLVASLGCMVGTILLSFITGGTS